MDFYIDLLFYHIKLKCYIAVELKTKEFKPEFAGKMGFYLTALDRNVKSEDDNQSIGLILCQSKNNNIVDYSLNYINKPVGISEYKIFDELPKKVLTELPTEEEINLHLLIDENDTINLNHSQKQILTLILCDKFITQKMIEEQLGLSRPTITRHIKFLTENGYIKRVGSRKSGYYMVLKRF